MRFDHKGMSLWYGTFDAPAPDEVVQAGTEILITVGVQPPDASNKVEVLYRVNQGPIQTVAAQWLRSHAVSNSQYFKARFPAFAAGDTVEYAIICRCVGRQVPSMEQAKQFAASFRVTELGKELNAVSKNQLGRSNAEPVGDAIPDQADTNAEITSQQAASISAVASPGRAAALANPETRINALPKLPEFKEVLAEKSDSPAAKSTIGKILKKDKFFEKPEDLPILHHSAKELGGGQVVDFCTPPAEVAKNIKTLEYTFKPIGEEKFFFGYQLIVTYTNRENFTIQQSYPIEDTRVVIVDLDLNDLFDNSKVSLQVKSAQGKRARLALSAGDNAPKEDIIEVNIPALANATINVGVDALAQLPNPPIKGSYQIKGKLLSNRSNAKLDGYQIVIYAATGNLQDGTPDFSPVAFARTETNGYFVASFLIFNNPDDINNVRAGKASVTKDDFKKDLPVRLIEKTEGDGELTIRKSMLPDRLILVINESNGEEEGCKDCGCSELNFHEKKVLEEYSYYTVVRTTEPSIIADVLEEEREINLEGIYGIDGVNYRCLPLSVFQKFHAIESKQIKPTNFLAANAAGTAIPENVLARTAGPATVSGNLKPAFNKDLLDKLVIEHKVKTIIRGNAKPVFKGRTHLNQLNQIDWDDEPTIYQAASIAHGHLLHFKQEWIPDGYSIGDLVYSLPLAPGQKKQIAVLDWERRESAANSQFLGYEETLNNSLVRDRDVNEVVSATLTENIRGNSKASTGGIGFGLGSSVMGIIPGVGSFGSLLGISGGTSSSGSSASQNSHRESTANSLQSITDRTMQAASVVRSQRATVVQTVSQGERVQATAESVANYNHCHAITIQYFEVLRHFAVHNRLAGVQECLFVPLQMAPFDLEKCLRWRNTLEKHLYRRELRAAFEAVARIQNEKESPFENYYDSIGFPRKNFAEQNINFYSGDLFMEFFFFNAKEAKIDDEIRSFYNSFGISLDGFGDRKITDEELATHVGPRAIEYLLDAFTVETDKGIDLKLDLTLISTFRQNANLRISVRKAGNTPVNIPRNQVGGINIKLDLGKLTKEESDNLKQFQKKYMKIRLRSGNLRYRTDNFSGSLFDGRIDNDIFAEGDGAFVDTSLLTRDELRNPRGEDVDAANNLLHHLNENLEYYHKCIFFDMTAERRFMLLDGIIAPGKAKGRSVASVVENRVIGIAGNSLIMPVAPGNQLDPTIDETFDLFAQYYQDEQEPMRISMPTKGIYAEAVIGKCNSCEEKDESRFWRWEESPIPDSPNTQILPLNTDTRRADPGNLQPKDFPSPVVNIQNAPNVPDPTGLQGILQLIGKGDAFRDLTGLNQNQLNALATFQKSLDTAQAFGKEAAELAKAAAANKLIEDAQKSGAVSKEKAKELTEKNINAAIPPSKEETMGLAQKQLDLINTLEQQGGITSEDAQSARKNIIENLTKGIDTAGTSAGDLGSLMEKASKLGTDVKKDGDSFEINSKGPTGIGGGGGGGGAPWAVGIDPFPTTPTVAFHVNEPGMMDAFAPVTVSITVNHLCAALVDLTGDPVAPTYAGLNDEEMVFSGSMQKICAMYAAFALRSRVQAFVDAAAANGAPVVPPGITNEIEKAWKPKLRALFPTRPATSFGNNQDITFPKLDQIFTFSPDGKVDFASGPLTIKRIDEIDEFGAPEGKFYDWMRSMMRWSNNTAASKCILALGYFYINGALAQAGLFDSATSNGLWLSADYAKHDWVRTQAEKDSNAAGPLLTPRWATAQRRRRSNITATAEQTARFMTLLAQGKLVDADANHADPSNEMRALMQAAIECISHPPPLNRQCGIGSYVKDALDAVGRDFTAVAAKKGFGDDSFSHECAIVERTVGGKDLRYVVVGLGSAPDSNRRDLSALFVLLDEAIVTRNS